jgi:hypothetical protein
MIFGTRSDIHDIAQGVERLVRAKGPQTMKQVFENLPAYMDLTRLDREMSRSRTRETNWQIQVRNMSRSQNRSGTYKKYPPIPECGLVYRRGCFALWEDQIDAHIRPDNRPHKET